MKTKLNNYLQAAEEAELIRIEAAAEEGEGPKLRKFSMLAYNGGVMRFWNERIVIDLGSMSVSAKARPILRDHNPSQIVGHTENIDKGNNLRVSGIVSGTTFAAEVVQASDNGFPWQASVGVDVGKYIFVEAGAKTTVNGREFSGPLYVAKNSTLKEVSFVALGADDNTTARVAAGSQQGTEIEVLGMKFESWLEGMGLEASALSDDAKAKLQAKFDAEIKASEKPAEKPIKAGGDDTISQMKREMEAAAAETADKLAGLKAAAGDDMEVYSKAIKAGWDADRVKTEVELKQLRAGRPTGPAIHMADKSVGPRVIEAALAQHGRLKTAEKEFSDKELQAAHTAYRGRIGLQDVLLEAAFSGGYTGRDRKIHSGNLGSVLKAAFSTIDISGVLSNTANKYSLEAFMAVESTWRAITKIRNVNDFKAVTGYRLTGDFEFVELAKDGEIEHSTLGEHSRTNQARTYARMLSITRQDIVNDDLGALTDVPRMIGRGGALKLNTVFWTEFMKTSASFWSATHATAGDTGNANYFEGATTNLQIDSVTTAEILFMNQVDADGKALSIMPRYLVVPPALYVTGKQIVNSTELRDTTASTKAGTTNPHAGRFEVLRSTYLSNANITNNSTTAWYMLADPMDLPVIETAFLDGVESPTVETAEADFNTLGIQMRGYFDFGVAQQEYRAGVKSKGAA